ncbi:MAG: MFS transporter [Pirellulaceae bacterium]
MSENSSNRLTTVQWLICFIAAIGFAFDIYELLMLPLIARNALFELGNIRPGTPEFSRWIGMLFYIPAFAGGIFGLLGGYLTDRLGRRRVLTWSILLYAVSAFVAGYSTNLWMLLICRCFVFVGVCVEFVAAVAWLAELFPDRKQREAVLGFTQAFSSFGGIMVAIAAGVASSWALGKTASILFGLEIPAVKLPAIQLPEWLSFLGTIKDSGAGWRYTLMSGLIPAIPLIIIRPFLPESPAWKEKKQQGELRRPSIKELFSPELKRTTIVTTLMFMCSFGAAFGAIQQMPQIVPGLPEVKSEVETAVNAKQAELVASGITAEELEKTMKIEARKLAGPIEMGRASEATKKQEIGGLIGRFVFAALALIIVSRRQLLRVFVVPGLVVMPIVFAWAGTTSLSYLEIGMFFAGLLTVAQFSFWGNYLPGAYPLHLRGTGEGFAANIGGRMLGTCFAAVTHWIALVIPVSGGPATKVAVSAALVAFVLYLANFGLSFLLPEKSFDLEHGS